MPDWTQTSNIPVNDAWVNISGAGDIYLYQYFVDIEAMPPYFSNECHIYGGDFGTGPDDYTEIYGAMSSDSEFIRGTLSKISLSANTEYTWRVKIWRGYDNGGWLECSWHSFNAYVLLRPVNPTPGYGATKIDFPNKQLSWKNGGGAESYDVYFGDADTQVFLGNQTETSKIVPYTTTVDENGVTHAFVGDTEINWNVPLYWRVDAKNEVETLTGIPWFFTLAVLEKATDPDPANEAIDVVFTDRELDWTNGEGADSWELFLGDSEETLESIATGTSAGHTLTDEQRALFTNTCYWRVDSINESGTTEGDVWYFVCAPPIKVTNPTPVDDAENIKIVGSEYLKKLTWEQPE